MSHLQRLTKKRETKTGK